MRYLSPNVASATVTICYWNSNYTSNRVISGVPLSSGYPALAERLSSPKWLERNPLSPTALEAWLGYSTFYTESGDSLLPPSSDLREVIVQAPTKAPTRDYRRRKEAGEILMNNYDVGNITIQRTADYDRTGATLVTPVYWNAFKTLMRDEEVSSVSHIPFSSAGLPEPTYGRNAGEHLRYVQCNCAFRQFKVTNATYAISPYPAFLNEGYGVDTELVTGVLADRNNGMYDILTELAEFPETLSFITEQTKKVFFMADATQQDINRAKKWMPLQRFMNYVSHKWLMFRYAAMPIFYSIKDVAEVLKQMGKEYAEYRSVKTILNDDKLDSSEGAYTFKVSGNCEHRCFIKSRYTPDSILVDLRRLININLANTAWETMKLSFVVDWVVNFGDFLSALTGSDGSSDSKCCYSVRDTRSVSISYSSNVPPLVTTVDFDCYSRRVINPLDHIGLSLRWDMGWKRYIDAAALSLNPILRKAKGLRL